MTESCTKPILFSTPMVQAILDDRKTQTRRIMKPQIIDCSVNHREYSGASWRNEYISLACGKDSNEWYCRLCGNGILSTGSSMYKCKYKVGDVLWVRETWTDPTPDKSGYPILYKADFPITYNGSESDPTEVVTLNSEDYRWKPSIHMPKEACRLFLKVTNVRVEKLHEITEEDAINEGIERRIDETSVLPVSYKIYGTDNWWDESPIISFQSLWQSINGEQSWKEDPFVWVIEFQKTQKP